MNDSDLIPGNENNTLYLAFKDANPCWLFVVNAIVKLLYVIPGIAANFAVILVTIRSKSLRSTANYLLAMNSLVEVFHQPGHLLSIWLALSSANFISYPLAVNICSLPVFGLVSVAPILFFTGIDRLLASRARESGPLSVCHSGPLLGLLGLHPRVGLRQFGRPRDLSGHWHHWRDLPGPSQPVLLHVHAVDEQCDHLRLHHGRPDHPLSFRPKPGAHFPLSRGHNLARHRRLPAHEAVHLLRRAQRPLVGHNRMDWPSAGRNSAEHQRRLEWANSLLDQRGLSKGLPSGVGTDFGIFPAQHPRQGGQQQSAGADHAEHDKSCAQFGHCKQQP